MCRTDLDRIALQVGNREVGNEPGGHTASPAAQRRQRLTCSGGKVSDRLGIPETLAKGVQRLLWIARSSQSNITGSRYGARRPGFLFIFVLELIGREDEKRNRSGHQRAEDHKSDRQQQPLPEGKTIPYLAHFRAPQPVRSTSRSVISKPIQRSRRSPQPEEATTCERGPDPSCGH